MCLQGQYIKKKSGFWPLFSVLDQTVTSIIKLAGLLYVSSLFLQLAIGNCNKLRAILKSDYMAHFTLGNVLKCKVQQVIEMGASSRKKYTVLQQLLHGTGNYTNHLKYCTNPQTLKIIYFCILLYADLEN